MNKNKIILDLCGGTGAWSKPYKKHGYDVRLITLPDFDILRWKEYPEIIEPVESGEVYGILSAPPCTEFSRAKGNRPRDFRAAIKIVEACMKIIWSARANGKLKFWVLENPMGLLRQFLGKPAFNFRQWQFGAKYSKETDLWGYFKQPVPTVLEMPKNIIAGIGRRAHSRDWGSPKKPYEYRHLKLTRADIRAITPGGFARAFYDANK